MVNSNKKLKVVHMITSAGSMNLMKGQLNYLVKAGHDVTVITSPGKGLYEAARRENVKIKEINMARTINPIKDFISLIKIIYFFLIVKPDVCNAGTPKAGLLGMIAAKITNVPCKVYTNRGTPFEGSQGLKKRILIATEKISCICADKVICISPSIKDILIHYNITTNKKTVVFGIGSSNGLQLEKYNYTNEIENKVNQIKNNYDLEKYNFILGSVGRLNNFKGTKETVLAFERLQKKYKNICLILVGVKEKKDPISKEINDKILNNPDIIEIGKVNDPIPYYYLMDVLSFPTYREGFGNVSIEAQATGTPVITTDATGSINTILQNETGFLVEIKDVESLENTIKKCIENPQLVKRMGNNGKKWVMENFDSKLIWESLNELYKNNVLKK